MLECFESVVVAVVALLPSRPEVNQSKPTLAGSVVFIDVVVVGPGLVDLVLDIGVALLPSPPVEFDVNFNQLCAALMGFGTRVDGTTLGIVNDGDVANDLLLSKGSLVAGNCGVNISLSRSSTSAQESGREAVGV